MAISTLFIINGKDWTGSILTPFKIGRNKLWGEDTGRVMSGRMSGTLIGIFPKLEVQFFPRSETDLSSLIKELDKAQQTIKYYNPITRSLTTMTTYTNDYTVEIINLDPFYSAITASFIAIERE